MKALLLSYFLCVLLLPGSVSAHQQADACSPPDFKIAKEKNMFSEQQEAWLGQILDEEYAKTYNKVEDPDGYLQKLGEHILAQLPATGRKYTFYVIDYPENNAFSLGGSQIYVSRQLIAFLKSEDELAGLLGHEIGHIATHQAALDTTRVFRKKLGVQQVGDRNDIFAKWNELIDLWRKKHVVFQDFEREEYEQQVADRLGLYAMMRAGYHPAQEFRQVWNRSWESAGTGVTQASGSGVALLIRRRNRLESGPVTPNRSVKKFPFLPLFSARRSKSAATCAGW